MAVQTLRFDSIRFDLVKKAKDLMLSQYNEEESPVLNLLLQVYISEVQELSDAIADLMEYRSIAKAQGTNLDAIGRIVGRNRRIYNYDVDFWFAGDTSDVQPDNGNWWCKNAQQAIQEDVDDNTYRKWIWMQILENHNLYSSTPEIEGAVKNGIGSLFGIERSGPIEAKFYVQSSDSLTNKNLLQYNENTEQTDNDYLFAYPATTSISEVEEV